MLAGKYLCKWWQMRNNKLQLWIRKNIFKSCSYYWYDPYGIKLITKMSTISSHQRCSIKKMFLKISQYSQESTCVGVYFNKTLKASNFQKETATKVFSCEYCKMSKNPYLDKHLRTAVSRPWNLPSPHSASLRNHTFPFNFPFPCRILYNE